MHVILMDIYMDIYVVNRGKIFIDKQGENPIYLVWQFVGNFMRYNCRHLYGKLQGKFAGTNVVKLRKTRRKTNG